MYEENSLTHWGIKGMKWGVRRYQNKDGSLTPAGKKRYEDETSDESTEDYEAAKQKALKSGSAREVLKFKGDLTNDELRKAKDRLDLEKQLKDLEESTITTGRDKVQSVVDDIKLMNSVISEGTKVYNNVSKIFNLFKAKKNNGNI